MIISYLKVLNGGFGSIAEAGLWAQEKVCVDTALTDRSEIRQYLHAYGFPKNQFNNPSRAACPGYDHAMQAKHRLHPHSPASEIRFLSLR